MKKEFKGNGVRGIVGERCKFKVYNLHIYNRRK